MIWALSWMHSLHLLADLPIFNVIFTYPLQVYLQLKTLTDIPGKERAQDMTDEIMEATSHKNYKTKAQIERLAFKV